MKKFIALFLVLVMAFSCILVSCKKDKDGDDGDDDGEGDGIGIGYTTSGTTGTGATVETGNTHTDFTFTDVNETVWVTVDRLNFRNDTNTSEDSYVKTVYFGTNESFTRIRYNAQWSEIKDSEGKTYYVASRYLTTDKGSVTFTNYEETNYKTVYVTDCKALNLRYWTDASDDANNIGTSVKYRAQLTQVGLSENGRWAKVKFVDPEGQKSGTYYCNAKYLTETLPPENTTAPQATGSQNG